MIIEATLTEHIIALRERVARMESEVRHLAHGQDAHSGSQRQTAAQLAHIALSLRDAHHLIAKIQEDVEGLTAHPKVESLGSRLKEWAPVLAPASMGVLVLLLTLIGKQDLAAKLGAALK